MVIELKGLGLGLYREYCRMTVTVFRSDDLRAAS